MMGEHRTMPPSWRNSAYQQAIWRARKRLAGQQSGHISPLESKILSESFSYSVKPDYSNWNNDKHLNKLNSIRGIPKRKAMPFQRTLQSNTTKVKTSTTEVEFSHPSLRPQDIDQTSAASNYIGPRTSAVEYLSVVDQATVHKLLSPHLRGGLSLSTTYEDFGLCLGCFHQKGPHHHYLSPVRIGGGYSIYHRNRSPWEELTEYETTKNTIRWLSSIGKHTDDAPPNRGVPGDEYSVKLFEQYINNGGDAAALKEYLDSNFNESVLEELKESGVDVLLLLEYTDLYRTHIKRLLERNIEKQSQIVEEHEKQIDSVVMFANFESDGADMKMLVTLLEKGRQCEEIVKFENEGGNIEILEHFAEQIFEEPSRDTIISEFKKLIKQHDRHLSAHSFLDYLKSGGELAILKKCSKDEIAETIASLDQNQAELLERYISQFADGKEFLNKLNYFLGNHLHLYQAADLLQHFIESGGSIKKLKDFVKSDCKVIVESYEEDNCEETIEETKLLKKVGKKFMKREDLKQTLLEFPEEPRLLSVYIQNGGNFRFLVKAVSDTTGASNLEDYVKHQADEALRKFNEGTRIYSPNPPNDKFFISRNNQIEIEGSASLPTILLPGVLEKAQADLVFDELTKTETTLKENEGPVLSKAVDFQELAMGLSAPSNQQEVTHLYQSLISPHGVSPISSVTGKKRTKLWTAPKPFEIKRSSYTPTQAQSPFTQNRIFNISALTEDHITDAARKQRQELDALRRTFHIEEFQKNWKLSITSPRGSVVSADPMLERKDSSSSLINRVISSSPKLQQSEAPSSKKTRRQLQREKLRAAKRETRRSNTSSTSSLLSIPQNDLSENNPHYRDTFSAEDLSPSRLLSETNEEFDRLKKMTESAGKSKVEIPNKDENDPHTIDPLPDITIHSELTSPVPPVDFTEIEAKNDWKNDSSRFGTAFGPKVLSASNSSLTSVKEIRKMIEDPVTMVSSMTDIDKDIRKMTSSSGSFLGHLEKRNMMQENLNEKIKLKRMSLQREMTRSSGDEDEDSYPLDSLGDSDMNDLLKQYCIIREDRLHLYKRIFDKYVLVKTIRDREKVLAEKHKKGYAFGDGDQFVEDTSLEGQLKKAIFMKNNLRETIQEVQRQIGLAKNEVNKKVAQVALHLYGGSEFFPENPDVDKLFTFEHSQEENKLDVNKVTSVLRNLTLNMRLKCESDAEVRSRKVTLVHLREKTRKLKQREKALSDSLKQIQKLIQQQELERGFKRHHRLEFIKEQSFLYQKLHPPEEAVIDQRDLTEALSDLDPTLTFFDNSQLIEEIAQSNGITFRVFCVAAALHETNKIHQKEPCSLNSKFNICKEHYRNILGPGLDVLRVELEAAGINDNQKNMIVKKLSRNSAGRLDFLDFVTYVPLFLDIHSKIVANPLPV